MKKIVNIVRMMATSSAVAFILFSCKSKLSQADKLDLAKIPLQKVDSMYLVQTKNGMIEMRVVTGEMQHFENDTMSCDVFPEGMNVYAYTDDEVLESTIVSDEASHFTNKNTKEEIWKAYGNVVVKNIVKNQTMESDTIYWDQTAKEIYTDCYVRLYSDDGFIQGYGMRSDERARNAIILNPFNNFGVVVKDTTAVIIDSVNFIGPLLKK
ncbi:MAG: LPS export ABC transporter periplasmic protein LptC [Candidatus Cryptobacteroides sp.]|nr:LPS export ABC transporter periplasmic protein LptC [Candidatus Cryptobacteroides sp.]